MAENAVPDIVEMRGGRVIQQDRGLEFRCVADDAMIAGQHVAAHIRALPHGAIVADHRRPSDVRARLDDRAFAEINPVIRQIRAGHDRAVNARFQGGIDVIRQAFQRVPNKLKIIKQAAMGKLR